MTRLRTNERGTVAVMMAFLFPVLIAAFGLGFEITNWYLRTRAMQNAADAAAVAAATNASANYNVEAAAVAAQYGYVNGTNHVSVAASNAATCPAGVTPPCYSVTITSKVPLYLTEVIGYTGNATLSGAHVQSLTSAAVANQIIIQQPVCLLGLDTTGTAVRSNGGPTTDFSGCTVMSNSASTCNGSNLKATMGIAHATNNGCGNRQFSNRPALSDPYAYMASNIPTDLPAKCSNTYPQESKHGGTWSGGTTWGTGTKTLTGTASLAGNTLICGDLRLTGDVTIDAPSGAVLYIENGLLDLQGYTLRTANGSSVTLVFTGTNTGSYQHYPTDNSGGAKGTLDIQAPTGGPFPGMVIYQDPAVTRNVDFTYAGNNPTWDLTGGVYLPNADITISGVVNKSSNGANCFVMVAKDVLINGNGSFYSQSPDGSGCKAAGLQMPTATIPGRSQLVY
ncbi:MAG TPA: pilus assembly protein TadG-related protein [Pseudolabrys sp.]|nr:pilus assembly protein TadG-related protein [Pseudolabrys sp.]